MRAEICSPMFVIFPGLPSWGQNRLKAVLDSELQGRWTSGVNCEVRYNRRKHLRCWVIPRRKTLWLCPLLTGGSLTATRGPSRAAAADSIVTFGNVCCNLRRLGGCWLTESGRAQLAPTEKGDVGAGSKSARAGPLGFPLTGGSCRPKAD